MTGAGPGPGTSGRQPGPEASSGHLGMAGVTATGMPSPLLRGQTTPMLTPVQQDLLAAWPASGDQLASQPRNSGSGMAGA